jgi:hypothetical protein
MSLFALAANLIVTVHPVAISLAKALRTLP